PSHSVRCFVSRRPRPPTATLFPYTTLFRSPYTRKDGEDFVGLVADWWADGVETVWAIRRSDELAGMIGLHKITSHAHGGEAEIGDRKSTRLNSSHVKISYAVFCLKKKKNRR